MLERAEMNVSSSNSTWIAEDTPCITYGLRGVVHCQVQVSSTQGMSFGGAGSSTIPQISNGGPDLHSGVEGGAAREPMLDM